MDDRLTAQLERSRRLGFLGPGEVEAHLTHAQGFLQHLETISGTVVDLGSGGGVPGLVIASVRPDLHLVMVDAMAKRCRFLEEAVAVLELDSEVVHGRAEDLGRGSLRGAGDAVVARSFGPPAVTAECAAPLLKVGGSLVVSEPPETTDRWPAADLEQLGLRPDPPEPAIHDAHFQVLRQMRPCPDRFPRRTGIPGKRPLF